MNFDVIVLGSGPEILEFDLSNKTRGVYFVKIISGNKLINYKIVLQ